jgi:hypothetical protein
VTNKATRQYRIRNWRDYNSALVRRGSLTLWVEQGVAGRWRDTTSPWVEGVAAFTPTSSSPAR